MHTYCVTVCVCTHAYMPTLSKLNWALRRIFRRWVSQSHVTSAGIQGLGSSCPHSLYLWVRSGDPQLLCSPSVRPSYLPSFLPYGVKHGSDPEEKMGPGYVGAPPAPPSPPKQVEGEINCWRGAGLTQLIGKVQDGVRVLVCAWWC